MKTGIVISDDRDRDLCRQVEESLTTGREKTIPNRFLLVIYWIKNGLVCNFAPLVVTAKKKIIIVTNLNVREK